MIRSASRNKGATLLSVTAMALGLTIALLIGFWSINEFNFDRFHENGDRIYRICRQGIINNEPTILGSDFGPVAPTAIDRFPEIEETCRAVKIERDLVRIGVETFYLKDIVVVDPNFFKFFSFPLETGDRATCLDSPDKMVINQQLANQYFKDKNPVGQMISFYGKDYQVSAVMKNVPENSHLKFNLLVSIPSIPYMRDCKWGQSDNFLAYFRLKEGSNTESLAQRISDMTYEFFPVYKQFKITHFFQPLYDIHFSPGFRFDYVVTNDRRIVFIFISLASLILLIACFNFINIFISTSFLRAKSIGIKKINGSSRRSLFFASYFETAVHVVLSALIAIVLSVCLLPSFNQLANANLELSALDPKFLLYILVLLIFTILLAGTFPVLYILNFNPEEILRNRFKGQGITFFQRVLVVSQFVASIILICSSLAIKKQIYFIQNKELGFDKEQIIYLQAMGFASNYNAVRDELLGNPNIVDVTVKSCLPTDWNNGNPIALVDDPTRECLMENCEVSFNYTEMMKIPLVEGKNPFDAETRNNNECMVNESGAQALGLINPVGVQIKTSDNSILTIAGVLKNVNTKSLHLQVDPQIYRLANRIQGFYFLMIKTTGNRESCVETIGAVWKKYNPQIPFEYHFLDDVYNDLYNTEKVASKIISLGMWVALFLAFIGLFSISHYAIERRVKEVGIRKVNGAKVSEVLILLNRDFVKWVLFAFAIATPIAYYAMNRWLQNFAYKTELSWWIFALAGLLALGIALLTVSWQSWKAATRNPVESLRYE